jgi:hypothetical protein
MQPLTRPLSASKPFPFLPSSFQYIARTNERTNKRGAAEERMHTIEKDKKRVKAPFFLFVIRFMANVTHYICVSRHAVSLPRRRKRKMQ